MLRLRAGDQAPEDVTHNQRSHAAIWLTQRHHASKPHGCEDLLRHVGVGQSLTQASEQSVGAEPVCGRAFGPCQRTSKGYWCWARCLAATPSCIWG